MMKQCFSPALKSLLGLFVLGIGIALAGPAPKPLKAESLQTILKAHTGEPFMLVLWSLRCAPCHKEMEMLSSVRQAHPKLELVFVSTDGLARIEAVKASLKEHGLANTASWIFAGPVQRLRYAIDPNWYGILPRSYLYNSSHERIAVTGGLEKAQVLAWLEQVQS